MKMIRESSYFLKRTLCHLVQIVSQCILCQPYSQKKTLMDSMFHNFNLLTFVTQLILHIKDWLSCVAN